MSRGAQEGGDLACTTIATRRHSVGELHGCLHGAGVIGDPAGVVTAWIASLPIRPWFYAIASTLAVLYALVRCWQWWNRFGPAGDGHPAYVATNQTGMVKRLRRRAFTLETWAHCTLAGSVVTLLGGIYFTLFVVPAIVTVSDVYTVIEKPFKWQYSPTLGRIADGQYWLKVAEVPALAGQGPVSAAFFSDTRAGTGVYKGVVAETRDPSS